MLIDSTGEPATKVGDEFVIHMDREALNDFPMGRYDVTVHITTFEPDREIAWTIQGRSSRRSVTSTGTGSNQPRAAPLRRRTTTGPLIESAVEGGQHLPDHP